ncbi:hypothetical protein BGZ65_000138 [Modicella reniformis]|uniref:Coupling of ubiquitin conjugation to ER degradation protein 1 n=1 Tax=Modicella reniformis TaxID=1440133 RepID=A0A9P6SVF9_9FUNG|nr:hypothetical protein BGZ65_000138 [Modicella reniformis]
MTDFVSITIVIVIIFMIFRWLSASGDGTQPNRQAQNRGRIPPRPPARLVNPEMVETVRNLFPHVPTAAIHYDLQKTGSMDQTCENILREGNLPMPPAPRPATPPVASTSSPTPTAGSSSGSSHSVSVNGNLVQRFKLQEAAERNLVPEEPSKVWADTSEKRQEVFQSRREFMVLQARKRYLEQQARKAKEKAEKAKEVDTSA